MVFWLSIINLLSFCMAAKKPRTTFPRMPSLYGSGQILSGRDTLEKTGRRSHCSSETVVTTKVDSSAILQGLPRGFQESPASDLLAQILVADLLTIVTLSFQSCASAQFLYQIFHSWNNLTVTFLTKSCLIHLNLRIAS